MKILFFLLLPWLLCGQWAYGTDEATKILEDQGSLASASESSSKLKDKKAKEKEKKQKLKERKEKFGQQLDVLKFGKEMATEFSVKLRNLVEGLAGASNADLQSAITAVQVEALKEFEQRLPDAGFANWSEEIRRQKFNELWEQGINRTYDIKHDYQANVNDIQNQIIVPEATRKTTLISILLRQPNCVELKEKLVTLFQMGASKNLHPDFYQNPSMISQKEYPIGIILFEIKDKELRERLLDVILDDGINYVAWKKEASQSVLFDDQKLEDDVMAIDEEADWGDSKAVIASVYANRHFILEKLIDAHDYTNFSRMIDYLEAHTVYLVEPYKNRNQQVDDEIESRVLEYILKKMRAVRQLAMSYDKEKMGQIDNIKEFFNSSAVAVQMQKNHDVRFSESFQRALEKDYDGIFEKAAIRIDSVGLVTQNWGKKLKQYVIDWAMWAHFRNRVARHLNRFALKASNRVETSNVVRLVRYVRIFDETQGVRSKDEELFKELSEGQGDDIIFLSTNRYRWTPAMYAMFNKQWKGILLYLRQAPGEVNRRDGVHNNILHLAFPLPRDSFKEENQADKDRADALSAIAADVGKEGVMENTRNAIIAIIEDKHISDEMKVDALTQRSALQFTPVSLAAAMGFIDVFNFLESYLIAQDAWDPDSHSYLGASVDDLMLEGIANYKEKALKANNFSDDMEKKIKERMEELDRRKNEKKNCITKPYFPGDLNAVRIAQILKERADKVFRDWEDNNQAEDKGVAPYADALNAAVQELRFPSKITVEVMVPDYSLPEPQLPPPAPPEANIMSRAAHKVAKRFNYYILGKVPPAKPKPRVIVQTAPRPKNNKKEVREVDSPLMQLVESTTTVKASYLGEVVKDIVRKYLNIRKDATSVRVADAYKQITGQDTNYFKEKFNRSMEVAILKLIETELKSANRLAPPIETSVKPKNIFDDLAPTQDDAFNALLGDNDSDDSDEDEEDDRRNNYESDDE